MRKIRLLMFFFVLFSLLVLCGCATKMLPAGDVEIPEYCKDEIAVLKNPKIPSNSKEKYDAAQSIAKKIDFSYARDLDFVLSVFSRRDVRSNNPHNIEQIITFYYPYEDHYVAFVFHLYQRNITKSEVMVK